MRFAFVSLILAAALAAAGPANDWSKPYFDGECAYEIPHKEFSGVFKLVLVAILKPSRISPAAGRVILDCVPNTLEQDIRLICQSHDETGCQHMFDYHGPEDKIVRLPESCGHGPFARIASARVAQDQTIPDHIEKKIARRDGIAPLVHHVTIDTNFALVDLEKTGHVEMAYQAINIPGVDANFTFEDFDPFGWLKTKFNELGNTISRTAQTVTKAVTNTVQKIGEGIGKAWKTVSGFVAKLPENLSNLTVFDVNVEVLPAKTIEMHGNNSKIIEIKDEPKCHATIGGHLDVTLDGDVLAQVTIGVTMKGHVVPPSIDDFHFVFDLNADIDTKVKVNATLNGNFQSKRLAIFEMGIPLFSVPGIFEVGPWIELEAQAKAHLELALEATLDLQYHVQHMRVWWPARKEDTSKQELGTQESKNPLTLKLDASIAANAVIEGHIIPSVRLGIKLGKSAEASAFVEADAYARLTLGAEAKMQAEVKRGLDAPNYLPPYSRRTRNLILRSSDSGVSAGFTGCVWLTAGVTIAGGVLGELGSLKASAKAVFWKSDELQILEHCWHAGKDSKDSKSKLKRLAFDFAPGESQHDAECRTKAPSLSPVEHADQLKPKALGMPGKSTGK